LPLLLRCLRYAIYTLLPFSPPFYVIAMPLITPATCRMPIRFTPDVDAAVTLSPFDVLMPCRHIR